MAGLEARTHYKGCLLLLLCQMLSFKGKIKTKQMPHVRKFSSKELQFFWKDSHIFKDMQVQVHEFVWGKGVITQNTVLQPRGPVHYYTVHLHCCFKRQENWLLRILKTKGEHLHSLFHI